MAALGKAWSVGGSSWQLVSRRDVVAFSLVESWLLVSCRGVGNIFLDVFRLIGDPDPGGVPGDSVHGGWDLTASLQGLDGLENLRSGVGGVGLGLWKKP